MADSTDDRALKLLLTELIQGYRADKHLADRALAQLDEPEWHVALAAESNSAAVIVRHVTGNLRSRWTDFLTTAGEKPDRHRDGEFEPTDMPVSEMLAAWEQAFDLVANTLATLTPADLERTVTIRGQP